MLETFIINCCLRFFLKEIIDSKFIIKFTTKSTFGSSFGYYVQSLRRQIRLDRDSLSRGVSRSLQSRRYGSDRKGWDEM